jgi:ATP-dependent RNA helicase MSS116
MSAPQAEYMPVALSGSDTFVKAKTGSGKTLGFLIPLLERVRASTNANAKANDDAKLRVSALVVSPSRELADQTRREAERLASFHDGVGVQMVIGGTSVEVERRRLLRGGCDILIGTPGRLLDHIENLPGLRETLQRDVKVLVIDEADRLLDMGFLPALKRVISVLPPPGKRQALMFTATVPQGVLDIAKSISTGYTYVDTAKGATRQGLASIRQEFAVVPVDRMVAVLYDELASVRQQHKSDHRVIVFFTTARLAQFVASIFRRCPAFADVLELHSRLSQAQRNKTTELFAKRAGQVLFASDVIARGIDFPDVTHVFQLGFTDPQQYEHRVGRTGRGGKSGQALLILCNDERSLVSRIQDAKLQLTDRGGNHVAATIAPELAEALQSVPKDPELAQNARQAYTATLGFYASNMKKLGMTPAAVVAAVNARFAAMGVLTPPAIKSSAVAKMHLKGAPGLRIASRSTLNHSRKGHFAK